MPFFKFFYFFQQLVKSFQPEGRHFTYCLGDYLGCVKDQVAKELVQTFTWENGVGLLAVFAPSMAYHGDRSST